MKKFIAVLLTIGLISCFICIGVSAFDEDVLDKELPRDFSGDSVRYYNSYSPPSIPRPIDNSPTLYEYFSTYQTAWMSSCYGQHFLVSYVYCDRQYSSVPACEIFSGDYYDCSLDFCLISATSFSVNGVEYSLQQNTQNRFCIVTDSLLPAGSGISTGFGSPRFIITSLFDDVVSNPIGFFGQVLNFITSTPFILALVGLSIGLAIVPFAVVKLKELVKGY